MVVVQKPNQTWGDAFGIFGIFDTIDIFKDHSPEATAVLQITFISF